MVFISILYSGDSLYKDLETEFQKADGLRQEIANANYHRSDAEQLKKYKELFLE